MSSDLSAGIATSACFFGRAHGQGKFINFKRDATIMMIQILRSETQSLRWDTHSFFICWEQKAWVLLHEIFHQQASRLDDQEPSNFKLTGDKNSLRCVNYRCCNNKNNRINEIMRGNGKNQLWLPSRSNDSNPAALMISKCTTNIGFWSIRYAEQILAASVHNKQ